MTSQRTRERLVQRLIDQGIVNQQVLDVMRHLPRHLFLDEALSHRAYEDTALPIGHGQTLSQPYIVARMTEMIIAATPVRDKVLEIGTGSGYQTAVLAPFAKELYSVERIKPLQDKARQIIRQLRINNVRFHHADGGFGWPSQGPFNVILSAAAPARIPEELKQQLAPDGVLIIPVGEYEQVLTMVLRKGDSDEFHQQQIEPVKFVPLVQGVTR
ncbi:protein-L-isoaspartate(D-aspartate) O-methyltransferase [Eionea flava]